MLLVRCEQLHSKGARSFVGHNGAQVDRLLDLARSTADPRRKKQLVRQVHSQVGQDRPMAFLWTLDSCAALSTKVRKVHRAPVLLRHLDEGLVQQTLTGSRAPSAPARR